MKELQNELFDSFLSFYSSWVAKEITLQIMLPLSVMKQQMQSQNYWFGNRHICILATN
jgi:hypothetical protein